MVSRVNVNAHLFLYSDIFIFLNLAWSKWSDWTPCFRGQQGQCSGTRLRVRSCRFPDGTNGQCENTNQEPATNEAQFENCTISGSKY